MNSIYNFIRNIFSYSYSEARGFFALLIVCIIALLIIFIPKFIFKSRISTTEEEAKYLDSLVALLENKEIIDPFIFDPNKLSVDSLILLGFPQNVSERLDNYRQKGGKFMVKSDVRKIYGISDQLIDSLYLFIDLPETYTDSRGQLEFEKYDINLASTEQLKKVNLIGDVLATRIVSYRELLGGFVDVNQLEEVYGLTNSTAGKLKASVFVARGFRPELLSINNAKFERLRQHPYISSELAEDIVRFREINSSIESEKVLANFKSIDKSNFKKLIVYLDFR